MKINLIIFISEFNLGGAGNSIFKLCKNLPKNKFKISIICLNKCYYKDELSKIGVELFEIKSKKTFFAMQKIRHLVKRLIRKDYKNIYLSNIHFSNILSVLFLNSIDIKIILVERTPYEELKIYYNFFDFIKKNLIKILINFTFHRAHACVSNSKYISDKYNENYNLNFKTINPPSFKKLNFLKSKKKLKKQVSLGVVSRLSKEKKIENLIYILKDFNENVSLKIVGDGPQEKKLKKIVNKLGLKKRIIFLGSVHPKKITKVLKSFDYLINISDFEGFPNSVVEALSAGIPVLASQSYGGINDIIKSKKYGFIFKDIDELRDIIEKILSKKYSFYMDKKELNSHLKKFSEKKNSNEYQKLFMKI